MNGNGLPQVPACILPIEHAGIVLHGIIQDSGIPGNGFITTQHTTQIAQLFYARGGVLALRDRTELDHIYQQSVARARGQVMPQNPAPAPVAPAFHSAPAFVPQPAPVAPVAPAFIPPPVAQLGIPTFAPPPTVAHQASAANVPLAPPQAISGDRPPGLTSPVIDVTPLG